MGTEGWYVDSNINSYTVTWYGNTYSSLFFETYEEALEEASRLATKNEMAYRIYKAVAEVKPETPPVKVTKLDD